MNIIEKAKKIKKTTARGYSRRIAPDEVVEIYEALAGGIVTAEQIAKALGFKSATSLFYSLATNTVHAIRAGKISIMRIRD